MKRRKKVRRRKKRGIKMKPNLNKGNLIQRRDKRLTMRTMGKKTHQSKSYLRIRNRSIQSKENLLKNLRIKNWKSQNHRNLKILMSLLFQMNLLLAKNQRSRPQSK